jgi:predicted ArsR family transcriptional regulator
MIHSYIEQRARILDAIQSRKNGATRQELEERLGLSGDSVRPRVCELRKAGLVVENGACRTTRAGRPARVLVAR